MSLQREGSNPFSFGIPPSNARRRHPPEEKNVSISHPTDLESAFLSLEEAQDRAARRKALDLSNIPIKVTEIHGQFQFVGYVARSRVYTCKLCETKRTECMGVYTREDHVGGGQRYTLTTQWPQENNMRHEVEQIDEPFCFSCIQELGFTVMEDLGERKYMPQEKILERNLVRSTNRIIPQSVGQVLQRFAERPSKRQDLDVQEMLDELSDGSEQ